MPKGEFCIHFFPAFRRADKNRIDICGLSVAGYELQVDVRAEGNDLQLFDAKQDQVVTLLKVAIERVLCAVVIIGQDLAVGQLFSVPRNAKPLANL